MCITAAVAASLITYTIPLFYNQGVLRSHFIEALRIKSNLNPTSDFGHLGYSKIICLGSSGYMIIRMAELLFKALPFCRAGMFQMLRFNLILAVFAGAPFRPAPAPAEGVGVSHAARAIFITATRCYCLKKKTSHLVRAAALFTSTRFRFTAAAAARKAR